jgi:hypothetical protein
MSLTRLTHQLKAETFIQNFPIVQKINEDVEVDFSLTSAPLFTTNYFTVPLKGNKLFQNFLICPLIEGCMIEGEILAINKPIEYPVIPPVVPPQPVPQMLQVLFLLSLTHSLTHSLTLSLSTHTVLLSFLR